jgi:hypothetical protein
MTPTRVSIVGPPRATSGLVLCLRELGDIGSGILEGDELATLGQRDRIVERTFLPAISHSRPVAAVSSRAVFACERKATLRTAGQGVDVVQSARGRSRIVNSI